MSSFTRPAALKKGDKVAIVSLSSGALGEDFCKHELEIGIKRLREMGLEPVVMPNAARGIEYIKNHPEARAADLKQAFLDDDIRGIITAIGGDDTYRTIPYLMRDEEFKNAVREHPKTFVGFSDTTNNHLMLNKLGLITYYGPSFLADIAELDTEMLPYTAEYFNKLFSNEGFEIASSPVWYNEREKYDESQVGVPRVVHQEEHGFETLNGRGVHEGELYGGCIESIYDAMTSNRHADAPDVYETYRIWPEGDEWSKKILFLETSDEKPNPEKLKEMLIELKNRGIFAKVQGVLVGKPDDEKYYDEYKKVYREVFGDLETPVLYNLNFGHAVPRCVLPYGEMATVDFDRKTVKVGR